MERTQIFELMGELKLYGMKAAFDEIMAAPVKRQHEPQHIVADLLNAEINEKHARSMKYQLTIAKLPLAKDVADFQFDGAPDQPIPRQRPRRRRLRRPARPGWTSSF